MTSAFSSIEQGLKEVVGFSESKMKNAVIHEFGPLGVKEIRAKVGMSHNEFASAFGISVSTLRLRTWRLITAGASIALLNVVAKEPERVLRVLASSMLILQTQKIT